MVAISKAAWWIPPMLRQPWRDAIFKHDAASWLRMAFIVPELAKRKNASNEKCRHSVLSWMGLLQLTGYDTCFYRAGISLDQS
jgi:hypothetical protein